jgi:hypothetical protein
MIILVAGIGTSITSTEKCGVAGNMKQYYIFNRAGFSAYRAMIPCIKAMAR